MKSLRDAAAILCMVSYGIPLVLLDGLGRAIERTGHRLQAWTGGQGDKLIRFTNWMSGDKS